jgi:hypothetical protein
MTSPLLRRPRSGTATLPWRWAQDLPDAPVPALLLNPVLQMPAGDGLRHTAPELETRRRGGNLLARQLFVRPRAAVGDLHLRKSAAREAESPKRVEVPAIEERRSILIEQQRGVTAGRDRHFSHAHRVSLETGSAAPRLGADAGTATRRRVQPRDGIDMTAALCAVLCARHVYARARSTTRG